MISGLEKEYPKASKSVLQKAQYEQKNSSVSLKNGFEGFRDLSNIFLNFKIKLDSLNKKLFGRSIRWPRQSCFNCLDKILCFSKKN